MYSKEPRPLGDEIVRSRVDAVKMCEPDLCDFDAALARLGGDRSLLIEMVQIYMEDAPMLLIRISNGVREANCSDVLHAAHLLRGLAANFGATSVAAPAERLEEFAIEGRFDGAAPTVQRLQQESVRLDKALQRCR